MAKFESPSIQSMVWRDQEKGGYLSLYQLVHRILYRLCPVKQLMKSESGKNVLGNFQPIVRMIYLYPPLSSWNPSLVESESGKLIFSNFQKVKVAKLFQVFSNCGEESRKRRRPLRKLLSALSEEDWSISRTFLHHPVIGPHQTLLQELFLKHTFYLENKTL